MNYGRGIEAARTRQGISKRRLAALVGVDPSYITHLEAGKKTPSLPVVEKIATALEVPVYVLMLMSSDDGDLKGVDATEAGELARRLLDLLPAGEREDPDADSDA